MSSRTTASKSKLPPKERAPKTAGTTVKDLRADFELSQPVFARLVGASTRTVANFDSKVISLSTVPRSVVEIARLLRALAEIMRQDSVATWLQEPIEVLRDLKPIEVIERGELDRIWSMVYRAGSGQPI